MVPGTECPEEIRSLFSEYTDMLMAECPGFARYLEMQDFDSELLNLDKKYSPPDGRLYAAIVDGAAAGCGGFRKIDRLTCEMKRLFVRPEFRGYGIGRLISERLINEAQNAGYRKMLLDTLPFLKDALRLYKKLGFYEIPRYNENPLVSSMLYAAGFMIPALRGVTVDTGFVSHLGEGLGIRENILNLPGYSGQPGVFSAALYFPGKKYLRF